MACQTRPGVAPYLTFIHETVGVKVTQADWHEIRKMAADSGASLTRARVSDDEANDAAWNLAASVNSDTMFMADPEAAEFDTAANNMYFSLAGAPTTAGTIATINFLAEQGPEAVLGRLAELRAGKKAEVKADSNADTPDPKWAIQDKAALEADSMSDAELLDAVDALHADLDRLPKFHRERSPAQQQQWFHDYNRVVGIQSVAQDRNLLDSHGERYDTEGYIPKFENSEFIDRMGTSKVVELTDVSFNDLVRAFGEPTHEGDGDKVKAEWVLLFDTPEGPTVATIHDWKSDDSPRFTTEWSVGGKPEHRDMVTRYVNMSLGR